MGIHWKSRGGEIERGDEIAFFKAYGQRMDLADHFSSYK